MMTTPTTDNAMMIHRMRPPFTMKSSMRTSAMVLGPRPAHNPYKPPARARRYRPAPVSSGRAPARARQRGHVQDQGYAAVGQDGRPGHTGGEAGYLAYRLYDGLVAADH